MEASSSETLLTAETTKLYQSKIEHVILTTYETLEVWKKYESDYITLKNTLEELDQETEYKVMIPLGKLAFMPGKLIHTNEIMAMLGDNWFAERSTKQAVGIVERRIEMVRKTIEDLEIQLENQRAKVGLTADVLELGSTKNVVLNEEGLPFVEIVEKDETENEGRDQVKSNVQRKSKESENTIKQTMSVEDEQLFDALIKDEQELAETIDSDDDEDFEVSGSSDYEDELEEDPPRTKKVTFADQISSSVSKTPEEATHLLPSRSIVDIYTQMLRNTGRDEDTIVEEVTHRMDARTETKSPSKEDKVDAGKKFVRNTKLNARSEKKLAVKSTVVEKEIPREEQDADSIEKEIWMKEIASEYQQKRLNFISQQGGLSTSLESKTYGVQPQVQDTMADKPKKVSRFKAARLKAQLE
ncbi:14560_t:CDS:2 [Acaulospora morrowiae]|uniref:14560_t:CDS:1 n=1 Tax=Acaulospora morrowiae TaxID=94023 RepID=A0A9N8ZX12_9GLOM|nr:14560_t:CDS:2 [Acaulospora morrowiae]